jgi:hypothetical protein
LPATRWFNWLFPASQPAHSPVEELPPQPSLDARLREIESQLRDIALLRIEWTEVLDKLQAWTNRQNARDAKRLKAGIQQLSETHEDAPETTTGVQVPTNPAELKQSLRQRLRAQNGGLR